MARVTRIRTSGQWSFIQHLTCPRCDREYEVLLHGYQRGTTYCCERRTCSAGLGYVRTCAGAFLRLRVPGS